MVHIHTGIPLSHKKNDVTPLVVTQADRETITLSGVSQRQIPYDITYTWDLKYGTNEPIHETETRLTDRAQTGGPQAEGGLGG